MNTEEVDKKIADVLSGLNLSPKEDLVIMFKCSIEDGNQIREMQAEIDKITESLNQLISQFGAKCRSELTEEFFYFYLVVPLSLFDMIKTFLDKVKPFTDKVQVNFDLNFGFKNSLKDFFSDAKKKFVQWMLEGFLLEAKLKITSGVLKTFKSVLQNSVSKKIGGGSGSQRTSAINAILSLLQSTKVHVVFKDIDDIVGFFEGLGVSELLDAQPSCSDVLEEAKVQKADSAAVKMTESFSEVLLKLGRQLKANFSVNMFKAKKFIVQLNGQLEGLGAIVDYIFS